jgi:uncharacterized protein (UPF0264 family)
MTAMLASVRNVAEAQVAFECGADIIDLKEPALGALGAVPRDEVRRVLDALHPRQATVSCTVGDLPCGSPEVPAAVDALHALGVDIVKFGVFELEGYLDLLAKLRPTILNGARLVAVIFADRIGEPMELIRPAVEAGLYGVMLDTADKGAGSLRSLLAKEGLMAFVQTAKNAGLRVGLAGSLRQDDIAGVLALEPHYVGFRGALCTGSRRNAGLDPGRVREVRAMIPAEASTRTAIGGRL